MTAQTRYVTSLLSVFSTFLESLSVSKDLALLTTENFIVFITNRKKNDENWTQNWSITELEKFISDQNVPHKSAFLMKKFVSDYTPFEVDIFLHEFLVSLKLEHRSESTIKNYKSDIQQFTALAGNKNIQHLFDPAHLRAFAHEQIKSEHKISTIKRKLASISQFALWAEKQKIVTDASFWISDLDSLISKNNNAVFSRYNKSWHQDVQQHNIEQHNTQSASNPDFSTSNSTSENDITAALENYLLSLAIDGHSEATIRNYKSDINQFVEFALNHKTGEDLGSSQLNKIITQEKITNFVVSQRKSGLKASSVKRKVTSLTQFFLWCESRNMVIGISNWVHSLSDIFFVSSSTELKLKPSPLVHAHEKVIYPENFATVNRQGQNSHSLHSVITKRQGWSLPIPSFAISESAHMGTDIKNDNENNPKNDQLIATKRSMIQENQNIFSGIRSSLNEFATQINTKRNKQFLPYLNLLMMILFAIGLGVLGYQQFITLAPTPFAYPSSPVRPNRELSFQGRLTDTAQNPITTATNMTFRLYDTGPGTGGTLLWNSGSCSVTPDQDGIFNVGLGDDCGAEITQDVFTENSNVWLEVQIAAETLTPRQSIKTVAYALNSETVQGYPISASGAATTNTILVMDAGGQVLLGEVSPKIKSTSGTFSIEAQALSLQTSSGSNGNIIINPDGTGKVIVQSNLDLEGYLHAPGATFSATYAGGTALIAKGGPSGTANIQEWQNSAGTTLALVDESGNVGIGTANPTATLQLTSATGTDLIKFQRTNATASNWSLGYNDNNAILIFKPASDQYWRVENAASSNVFEVNTITGGIVVGSSYGLTNPPANGAIIQGNVGIGTSNPGSKLHVGSGDIKLDAGYDLISETNSIEVYNGGDGALNLTAATNGPASRGINLVIGSTTQVRVDKLGNVGIGTTDPANFKLQITGNIGPTTDSTYNLGNATYAWANVYSDAFYQNGNLVCDSSGANCPASFGVNYWRLASGALSPVNDTTDLLIGSNASASAKFAFLNVNTGTPVASISGNSGNIATYLTGDGTLGTTNKQTLTIGNSSTYNTTGNVVINSNGTGNVGIGTTAPKAKLDVEGDIFTDYYLESNTNTFLGIQAVGDGTLSHTTGQEGWYNTAIGSLALQSLTTGNKNTAVGYNTGNNLTTGTSNVFVGMSIAGTITSGTNNIAIGENALNNAGSGVTGHTALGAGALRYVNGNYSTGIGYNAGLYNTSTVSNTYVGGLSGQGASSYSASGLTLIGYQTGYNLATNGNNNTFIGYQAGDSVTSGNNNIIIGYGTDTTSATATYELNIGNTIYGNISTGNVGVGTSVPGYKLHVVGNILGSNYIYGVTHTATTDGSAAVPSFGWNENDTGMFHPAANTIAFSTDATERFRIDSVGNVGIGTTAPLSKLAINGDLTANAATISATYAGGKALVLKGGPSGTANIFEIQTNGGSGLVTVDASGNTAVGTTVDTATTLRSYRDITTDNSQALYANSLITTATPVNPKAINAAMQANHSTGTLGTAESLRLSTTTTGAGNITTLRGLFNEVISYGSTGTVSNMYGTLSQVSQQASAGNVSNMIGHFSNMTANATTSNVFGFDSAFSSGTTGSVGSYYGYRARGDAGSGTVQNQYGFYATDMTAGTVGNYSILTNAGDIVFNEGGDNGSDFRVETDTDANAIFSQASSNNVGIGTNNPASFKLQVAGSVGPTVDSTYNLGSLALAWANIYGDAVYQNGNLVCDSSGANCPASFGVNYWRLASGALSPVNDTTDLLIGSNASASAKFAFLNVNTGTPVASVSGNSGNIATYLTGTGTLATTNRQTLTIGNSSTYNTTGDLLIHPNGTGNVAIGTTTPTAKLEVSDATSPVLAIAPGVSATVDPTLYLKDNSSVNGFKLWYDNDVGATYFDNKYNNDAGSMFFRTKVDGTAINAFTILGNGNIGVGTTTPISALNVIKTTEQLRLGYDASNYASFTTGSTGNLTITPSGSKVVVSKSQTVNAEFDTLEVSSNVTTAANTNYNGGIDSVLTFNDAVTGISAFRSQFASLQSANTVGMLSAFRTGSGGSGNAWSSCQTTTCTVNYLYGILLNQPEGASAGRTYNIGTEYGMQITGTNAYDYGGQVNVTNRYGIEVGGINTTGTAVTNSYGIYLRDQATSVTSTAYGIFGDNGDWVLDSDGNGVSGGTGAGGDLVLGEGQDLELYHDGTNSYIMNNTGDLYISDAGVDDVILSNNGGNVGIGSTAPAYKLDSVSGNAYGFSFADNSSGTFRMYDGLLTLYRPSNAKLTIDTGDAFPAKIELDANNGTDRWTIERSASATPNLNFYSASNSNIMSLSYAGNVGIATTNPASFKLQVAGSVGPNTDSTYNLGSLALAWANVYSDAFYQNGNLVCDSSGANCPASFGVNYWRLASGALSPVNDTTDLLIGSNASASAKFAFLNVNSGTPTASISGNLALAVPTGSNPATTYNVLNGGSFNLTTSPGGNAGSTSRIFISNSGNVGISSTSPTAGYTLDVNGSTKLNGYFMVTSGWTYLNSSIFASSNAFHLVDDKELTFGAYPGDYSMGYNSSEDTLQFVDGATIGSNVRMVLNSDGNVGIGTTAPLSKLAINGDLAVNAATISATYAAGIPLTVKGGPSGTSDIQQWQNSSGSVLARVESTGRMVLANNTSYAMYNAAGSGVVPLFRLDTSDNLNIGSAATVADTFLSGSSSFRTSIGGNEQFRAISTSFTVNEAGLSTIDFRVEGDTNANLIFADASADFVGIGTATPSYTLDVAGELNLTDAIRVAGSAGTSGYLLTSSGGGANTWTDPATLVSGSTWWANTLNVLHPKNEYANIVDLTLGGTSTSSADIHLYADGSATFNEQGNDADFRVETSGQANAFFIQGSDGNVGIGTNNPGSKLTVTGNVSVSGIVAPGTDDTYDLGSTTRRWQDLFLGPNSLHIGTNGNEAIVSYNTTSNYLGFDPDGDATNEFVILDGGNVGINTTTASSFMLEVAGSIGPSADNTYALGSAARRFTNIYTSGSVIATGLTDTDGDTKIQVEESADEDKIRLDTAGTERIIIDNTGKIGIGTSTPIHKLELSGAATGKALVMLKELGDQDILTASNSSGVTRFVLANTGYVHAERFADVSNSSYFLDPAGAGTSLAVVSNVGIGTTNPAAKLEVHNSSTEDILNLYDGASEVLTVIDGGYLGIGTTTPGYIVDVAGRSRIRGGSTAGGGLWLTTAAAPTTDITYFGRAADSEAWAGIYNNGAWRLYIPDASGNVGIGTSNPVQSLDTGGDLRVGGNDITDSSNTTRITLGATTTLTNTTTTLSGTTSLSATSLTGFATSASVDWSNLTALTFSADNATIYGSDIADGNLTLQGTSNATKTSSYVNLQPSGGYVGIGTTTPTATLDVSGAIKLDHEDAIASPSEATHNAFIVANTAANRTIRMGVIDNAYIRGEIEIENNNGSTGTIYLKTAPVGTANAVARLTVLSDGNIGIGTTAPTAILGIGGDSASTIKMERRTTAAAGNLLLIQAGGAGSGGTNLAGGELRLSSGNSTGTGDSHISFYTIDGTISGTGDNTNTEKVRIQGNGNVGIGTTTTPRNLTVAGTARITTSVAVTDTLTLCTDANGDIEFKSGACSTSSIKYKQNIENISYGLDTIREMNPVFFEYKDWVGDNLNTRTKRKVGFIAEEMELLVPEVVIKENGEIDGIDYAFLTSVLAKGIQELDAKVSSIFTNLVANTATIANLTVESIQIGGQTLENYILNVVNNQNNGNNTILSPVTEQLTVDSLVADTVTASGSSKLGHLLVKDLTIESDASVTGTITTDSLRVTTNATVSGSLLATLLESQTVTTQNASVSGTLIADTIVTNQIDAASSRIAALEAGMAQLETLKATTAELTTATVSGTLYAANIYDFENKVATTLQQPGLLDVLLGTNQNTTTQDNMQNLYDTVNTTEFNASSAANLDLSLTELSMTSDDVALTGTALFIEKYFKVNGAGYISDSLAVGNTLFVGQTMQIADGLIKYTTADPANQILRIQPDGQGKIELLAGIVTIDDTGVVTVTGEINITGNAKVGGTLLTNMLKPTDFGNPFQVQVAGVDTQSGEVKKSRFEIINEVGTPVATFSAEGSAQFAGKAEFAGGIGVASQDLGSSENNELNANKTSGKATIKAGATEVIIKSSIITNDSLVYVTAVGSTANQVLYVKSQTAEDTNTPDQDGKFVVGFDNQTSSDVTFNWWIVN